MGCKEAGWTDDNPWHFAKINILYNSFQSCYRKFLCVYKHFHCSPVMVKYRHGGIWPLSYWVMCGSLLLSYSCSSAEEGPLISYSPWTGLPSWHPALHVTTTLFWSQLIDKITRGSEDDRRDPNPAVVSDNLPLDFSALEVWGFVLNELLHSGCWNHP